MSYRGLFSACATVVLCATMVGNAVAYPLLARSGTTTVTGTYRPIDLHLGVVSGEWLYDPSRPLDQRYGLTAQLSGTFTSSYGAYGSAGNWTLNLGYNSFNINNSTVTGFGTPGAVTETILDSRVTTKVSGNTITLGVTASDRPVGTLVYNSGLSADLLNGSAALPSEDTPGGGDMFLLFAHNAGAVLAITETDNPNPDLDDDFLLQLANNNYLEHLGPYVKVGGSASNLYAVDEGRVNLDCIPLNQGRPGCGSVPNGSFFVSSVQGATQPDPIYVPEPASLALVGMGLAGLALVRRRQQGLRQV